ncbi:MAG: YihY family inner membrane protein [Rhodospirillaceae bacterium]|nr:MAG: YihY family inner membrane protein [Rhodospirillaceae bacterium]
MRKAQETVAISKSMARQAPGLVFYVCQRFIQDSCPSIAAALSYNSLLALVPLLAIGLAMFAAFPAFSSIREDMLQAIFDNLAPSIGDSVKQYLQTFVENAGKTTGAGVVGLGVTSILLFNTIQTAFDRIWGVTRSRTNLNRLIIYWALITLGPILFGASFSISGYVFATVKSVGVYGISTGMRVLSTLMPFLLETIGFAVFFRLIPSRYVRLGDAVTGAFITALLFEILKQSFALYLYYVPTYQAVYGAIATLPVFLLWMYLVWLIILVGAEITAALPEWRAGRRSVGGTVRRSDTFALALGVLRVLRGAAQHGTGLRLVQLQSDLQADPNRLLAILDNLKDANILTRGENDRWHISRDLRSLTLFDLCRHLGLILSDPSDSPTKLAPLVAHLNEAERGMLGQSVDDSLTSLDRGSGSKSG